MKNVIWMIDKPEEVPGRIILERWMKHSPAVAGDERIED
jgi:hypothetical protein